MIFENEIFQNNKRMIKKVLRQANQSEYYRSLFEKRKINVEEIDTYEDFLKIPTLDKNTYALHKYDMIVDKKKRDSINQEILDISDIQERRKVFEKNGIYLKVTSGSTGIPLEVLKDKKDLLQEYIGFNYARKKILGNLPQGKYVWIWPANKKIRDYFYEDGNVEIYQDSKYGFKYMMPEYSPESFQKLSHFILDNSISWITAPPSMLYFFAQYVKQHEISINFEYIECHSEKLFEWQAELIERVFGSHPVNVYSSNEVQFMAITDKNGKMNIIERNVFLELLEDEQGIRHVYATSLAATEIPIIRYELGDSAHWDSMPSDDQEKKYAIVLNGYRCNDYVLTRIGKKYEPFIISDLMILLNDSFQLEIHEYVVKQNAYSDFTIYFEDKLFKTINEKDSVYHYIKEYFENFIGEEVVISYKDILNIRKDIGTNKYKYFIGI